MTSSDPTGTRPEFGPRGYLPERAARRARKIVLREQLGLGWLLAAVAAGVLLLVVATVWAVTSSGGPAASFAPVAAMTDLPQPGVLQGSAAGTDVLIVTVAGPRAFAAPGVGVVYCAASRRLEAPAVGAVWRLDGQRVGGDAGSLAPMPLTVHAGTVYVDPSQRGVGPPPSSGQEAPACAVDEPAP
jgi:hypothetical protein